MKRYYSSLRPIGPGTYPKDGAQDIHNYDNRQYVEDAGCECWGYIDYNRELTQEELKNFELVQGGLKTFWVVTGSIDDRGRCIAHITATVRAAEKPESSFKSTRRKDIYVDYFNSLEAAQEFVEGYKTA